MIILARTNSSHYYSLLLIPCLIICYCQLYTCDAFLTRPRQLTNTKDTDNESTVAGVPLVIKPLSAVVASTAPTLPFGELTNLAIVTVIGFVTDPLVERIFNASHIESKNANDNFHETFLYGIADSIANGAKACGLVLLIDIIQTYLHIPLPFTTNLQEVAPRIGLLIWGSLSISTIKRTIFQQSVSGTRLGRVALYDKLIDFLLGIVTTANVLNELSIDIGMGLKSVFAASGVSALVFSLASKGLVEQIVGGFIIQAWDAIEEGEDIRLGDGTEGTVLKIGLVETEIMGYDNIATRIPNSQLTGQRVSNISRMTQSQVKQILRFKYTDLNKLPSLLDDIKQEIQNVTSPKLIVDGSKPFGAIISAYEPDHVQVIINCNYNIKPSTSEYTQTKQKVLLAIADAMKRNNIEFAIPSIYYKTAYEDDNNNAADQEVVAPPPTIKPLK